VKFLLGFLAGLLTGVTIVLAPLIAVVVGLMASGEKPNEETDDMPTASIKEPPLP
jgi:hypothetical protein